MSWRKYRKERVTIVLGANMSLTLRGFRGVKSLPVNYKSNTNAWMTGKLIEKWMIKLDKKNFSRREKSFILR